MDTEPLLKVGGAFAALASSAAVVWRLYKDLTKARTEQLREQYRFARDYFIDRKNRELGPYEQAAGLHALVEDTSADAETIEFVLSFPQPHAAIAMYRLGRRNLEFQRTASPSRLAFKRSIGTRGKRKFRLLCLGVLYFGAYSLAFTPLLLVLFGKLSPSFGASMFVLSVLLFLPICVFALRTASSLRAAVRLAQSQARWLALRNVDS